MSIVSIVLDVIFLVNILLAAVVIFVERQNPNATLAWVMVLLFLPVAGFIFYLIFNQNFTKKKMFEWDGQEKEGIQEAIQEQIQELENGTFPFHDANCAAYKGPIYMHLINDGALFTQDNAVTIYTDGREKFDALLGDIRQARDHVHIQYYIIHSDGLGKELVYALTEKAKEGLDVRILYDYMGSRGIAGDFYKAFKRAGGAIGIFFPHFHLNYRNHRKIAVIDGEVGYVGGFNVGDEYLGLDEKFGYWRDTHLRTRGSMVHALQARFFLDWNQASKNHRISYEKRFFPDIVPSGSTGAQVVSSGPDTEWQQIKHGYLQIINGAREYVYLQSPYFIPDESLLDALRVSALSGVDVRLMIPDKPDHPFVYWATLSHVGKLLNAGVKVYIYGNGFVHAKTLVADDAVASVGTANIDHRSFKLNFEVNAFLYSRDKARTLRQVFEQDIEVSDELTREKYAKRSFVVKVKESISRLLSPIL